LQHTLFELTLRRNCVSGLAGGYISWRELVLKYNVRPGSLWLFVLL
jgi:hypothetical protein